ncbi:MAG: hypothetical protein NTZ51_11540 [Proteobacteria bacterium]|nr:hypothetical protein [Pseudomonadota bacterium]
MKKTTVISIAVLLLLNGFVSPVMAQIGADINITTRKDVSLDTTLYSVVFDLQSILRNIKRASITMPNGRTVIVKISPKINKVNLEASSLTEQELVKYYPEGAYNIILFPLQLQSTRKVFVTHIFPPTPENISPSYGETAVSLTPEVKWDKLNNIDSIFLELTGGNLTFNIELPANATSFNIPGGVLQPDTEYSLVVGVKVSEGKGDTRASARVIKFTTANQ